MAVYIHVASLPAGDQASEFLNPPTYGTSFLIQKIVIYLHAGMLNKIQVEPTVPVVSVGWNETIIYPQ